MLTSAPNEIPSMTVPSFSTSCPVGALTASNITDDGTYVAFRFRNNRNRTFKGTLTSAPVECRFLILDWTAHYEQTGNNRKRIHKPTLIERVVIRVDLAGRTEPDPAQRIRNVHAPQRATHLTTGSAFIANDRSSPGDAPDNSNGSARPGAVRRRRTVRVYFRTSYQSSLITHQAAAPTAGFSAEQPRVTAQRAHECTQRQATRVITTVPSARSVPR